MKFSYFPGCTLKTKGAQLDTCGRKAAEALGFELCELPEWQCCGAVYPQATDEIATRLSSVRALAAADAAGEKKAPRPKPKTRKPRRRKKSPNGLTDPPESKKPTSRPVPPPRRRRVNAARRGSRPAAAGHAADAAAKTAPIRPPLRPRRSRAFPVPSRAKAPLLRRRPPPGLTARPAVPVIAADAAAAAVQAAVPPLPKHKRHHAYGKI